MAFPLWCAYPAVMAFCPLVSSAYKNIPKMEYLGLHSIVPILGNHRKLCHKTNHRRLYVGRRAPYAGIIGNALGEVIGIITFGIIGRIEKWRK